LGQVHQEVGDPLQGGAGAQVLDLLFCLDEAEVEGEVVSVAVNNGELVEFGQVLMTVRPSRP